MSKRDRGIFLFLAALWASSLIWFWSWWLRPEHNINGLRYAINSLVLIWTTIVPGYFVAIFARSRVPERTRPLPTDWRIAMVVTKAPSEPAGLVQRTLEAMLTQRFPHDTWLADEHPTVAMLDWCKRRRVRVSTRKGVVEYHNVNWPRRTKSKEGNLTYFYDVYGYEHYDIVVQLDADHVPEDGYLEEMIRPFLDPGVGYVSAPSICDDNAAESWSARGRLHIEGALHGALQAGYNGGLAPLCIGSHYAVRTRALKEIGGLGPELAEDHSTTLIMNAHGWRGVHALAAIAHGDGPGTFSDLAIQEFQWSRSLATIFLRYTPRYIGALPLRLKLQFMFSQAWYPLFALSMLASILIPIVALATARAWAGVAYVEFFVRMSFVTIAIVLIMRFIKNRGWFRPGGAKVLSWEGAVFLFARWPWALFGVTAAVVDWARGRTSSFRVTPKRADLSGTIPFTVLLPTLVISAASGLAVLLCHDVGSAAGFYVFAAINSLLYLGITVAIAILHSRENGDKMLSLGRPLGDGWPLKAAGIAALLTLSVTGVSLRAAAGFEALVWGLHPEESRMSVLVAANQKLTLGVYDPQRAFGTDDNIGIDHIFVSWVDNDQARIRKAFADARQQDRWLMVTVEPWPRDRQGGGANLLTEIASGGYDGEINDLCTTIADVGLPVLVRWGHEMDTGIGRYPWAKREPGVYIAAYRHFVDACRARTDKAYYVWSPAGADGLARYYPGRSYADIIGLSVYSFTSREMARYGRVRSFVENFGEKYDRVQRFDRPVMIAEFGVDGDSVHQRRWISAGLSSLRSFPLLEGIVYFNAKDQPDAWEAEYGIPDWTIDPHNLPTIGHLKPSP